MMLGLDDTGGTAASPHALTSSAENACRNAEHAPLYVSSSDRSVTIHCKNAAATAPSRATPLKSPSTGPFSTLQLYLSKWLLSVIAKTHLVFHQPIVCISLARSFLILGGR